MIPEYFHVIGLFRTMLLALCRNCWWQELGLVGKAIPRVTSGFFTRLSTCSGGQRLPERFYCLPQLIVFFHHPLDFANRMDDGGMIFAAETFTNFRIG